MRSIRAKLESDRGASLIFALLGFMTAALVSVIIITSSQVALMRIKDDHKAQQNRLTLSSAAALVRDELADCICTVTSKKTSQGMKTGPVFKAEGSELDSLIENSIAMVYTYGMESESSFFIHVKSAEEEILHPVKVEIVISKNENEAFQADAVLSMSEEYGGDVLYLSITANSGSSDSSETHGEVITCCPAN